MLCIFHCIVQRYIVSVSSIIRDAKFDYLVKVVSIRLLHCKMELLFHLINNMYDDALRYCESLVPWTLVVCINYFICSCNSIFLLYLWGGMLGSGIPTIMHFLFQFGPMGCFLCSVSFNPLSSFFFLFKLFLIWPVGEPFKLDPLFF